MMLNVVPAARACSRSLRPRRRLLPRQGPCSRPRRDCHGRGDRTAPPVEAPVKKPVSPSPIKVTVLADGSVHFHGTTMDMPTFELRLADMTKTPTDQPFLVSSGTDVPPAKCRPSSMDSFREFHRREHERRARRRRSCHAGCCVRTCRKRNSQAAHDCADALPANASFRWRSMSTPKGKIDDGRPGGDDGAIESQAH